ncbi:hypothetical protein KUCAC02_013966, partial [Chaenocephalus aceratus]
PAVPADSGLSNVPAAASSSIIKRLRRIEIISIRAPSGIVLVPTGEAGPVDCEARLVE